MTSTVLRLLIAGVVAVLLAGCATGATSGLTDASSAVERFARADVVRGLEIATAANDPAGMACASAILDAMPDGSEASLAPAGAFSLFMKGRELRRKVTEKRDDKVHNACAPLVLDAAETLGRLGLIAVPGGGVAGAILRR